LRLLGISPGGVIGVRAESTTWDTLGCLGPCQLGPWRYPLDGVLVGGATHVVFAQPSSAAPGTTPTTAKPTIRAWAIP
jgi:hypothetical protein